MRRRRRSRGTPRELRDDGVADVGGAGRAAEIAGSHRALLQDGDGGPLDAVGGGLLVQVPEHEDSREDEREWIRDVLARDVGEPFPDVVVAVR